MVIISSKAAICDPFYFKRNNFLKINGALLCFFFIDSTNHYTIIG